MLSPNNDEGGAPSLTGGCGSARTEESPPLEVHDGSTVLHLSPGSALVQHPGPSMPVAGSVASLTETYRNAGSLTEPKRTSGSESEDTTATEEQAPVPITADAKKLKSRCPRGSGFRVVATSCIPGLAKEPTFQQVVGVLSVRNQPTASANDTLHGLAALQQSPLQRQQGGNGRPFQQTAETVSSGHGCQSSVVSSATPAFESTLSELPNGEQHQQAKERRTSSTTPAHTGVESVCIASHQTELASAAPCGTTSPLHPTSVICQLTSNTCPLHTEVLVSSDAHLRMPRVTSEQSQACVKRYSVLNTHRSGTPALISAGGMPSSLRGEDQMPAFVKHCPDGLGSSASRQGLTRAHRAITSCLAFDNALNTANSPSFTDTGPLALRISPEGTNWDRSSLKQRFILALSLRSIFKFLIKRMRENRKRGVAETPTPAPVFCRDCVSNNEDTNEAVDGLRDKLQQNINAAVSLHSANTINKQGEETREPKQGHRQRAEASQIQENDATIPSHTAQEDALPQVEAPIASGKDGAASSSSGDDEAINGKNRSSGGVAEPRDPRVATVQAWAQNACSLAARQAPLSNFSGFVHAANNGKLAHAREAGHLADQTTDTVAAAPLCSAGSPNVGTSRAPPQPADTALRNTQRIASSSPQLGCKSMDIALQDPPRTVDRTSITEEPNKSSPASTRGCPNNPSCCADTSPRSVSGREVTHGGSSGNPTSMAEQQLLAAYRECFLLLAAAQRKEELRVFEFVLGGGSRDARLCGCKETQRHSDGAELNDASTRRNSSGPNADGLERTSEEQRIQATGPCEASPNAANLGESYTDSTAIEASIKEDDAEATPPNYSVPRGVETDSRLELKDVRNGGDASCVSPENDTDRSLSARGGNLEAEGAAATQDNANTDDRLWPANKGSDSGSRADKSNITTCGRNIYGRTGTYDDGNEEREASRKKRRTGWPSVLAPETWSERTLHFVLAALDGLRDAWREGTDNTRARAQLLESALLPLCLQKRYRESHRVSMPLQQQLQQLILGLQLLCELSPFCPALSSSASGSAHTKPAAGVTSASGAVEAATQGQHKTLPPRARVYGNPLGHLPPACEWLYPFSSRGAASGARLDQGSGTETECIGHGGAASLLQRLPPAASSGCCSCCCGCTFEAEHRCEARSSASSSESDKIHRRAEPSPMLEGHQGIRIHHCHGGRSGATERTSNARFQAPAGPDRRCSGTTGGVKGPTGNGCAVAEESTDSVEPVTTGAVGKQKRGRYRTAAVVAAEEGDATDIYKKPRPSVTSRRVLLQKQQQHIQESGAAADGDDEPTRAACSLSDANTLFSRFSSKSPTESSAATTYQLGQTQESVDDASREQRMQNLKTPTAARSPPSASLKRLAVGAMCADTYGLTRQNGLEPGVHSSSHGNLTACKATASDARGPAKEELSQNTQTASRRSEAAAPHLQKNESTSSHGNAPLSCKPTTASSGSAAPPVRTTRHNKTKQPGVFQFTRGIKRFWAASWYADGHPGWKAFSVEKWGNTEALKRAKKAYEEKVPHGAAMLNTLDFGAADDMASDDTPSLPVTGTGSGKDSNRTGSGSSLSVGSSQQRQRCDNGGEAQRSQDRGLTQQQVNGATRTGNTRKKQQPSQAGDGPAESPPLSLESGTIEYRSTPAGFSSSSSSSIFSCTTGQHMGDGVETTQKQHQIEREDFLQPIWDDLDSADTGNSGTGGVFTLGGASGGCATSSCYDTSSSSGFLRGKFSYSSKTAATELSVGYEDPISEGQRHVFFEHPRAHHDTELGRHGCDEPGIHEDDHGLLSPSQFFLGSDNDDITGRLLLSGPDTGALSISR